jgi:hypothetical protein
MTTKKKRKRPYQAPQTRADDGVAPEQQTKTTTQAKPATSGSISAASVARRERKDEARAQREAAQRHYRRQQNLRRSAILGLVIAGVAVGAWVLISRNQEASQTQDRAQAIATRQDCTQPVTFPQQETQHVDFPAPITYTDQPPVGGPHRPPGQQLPETPHVYTEQQDVTRAVHNLEHGYVIIWYQAGSLDQPVVDELANVADQSKVIMMPYDQFHEGDVLSFSSWMHRQDCPASNGDDPLTPQEAGVLAEAFIGEFRNGTDAPEPNAP